MKHNRTIRTGIARLGDVSPVLQQLHFKAQVQMGKAHLHRENNNMVQVYSSFNECHICTQEKNPK